MAATGPTTPDEATALDEWSVRNLDLDAYLQRIGYDGPLDPSHATLAGLHRAHLAAIPFENLDLMLGRGVRVDFDSIQAKLVFANRGGYCYEQGQLFGAVLERLGYQVDRLLARVGPDGEPVRPRTHLTLRVGADAGTWLADVGFGNSPPGPLALRAPQPERPAGTRRLDLRDSPRRRRGNLEGPRAAGRRVGHAVQVRGPAGRTRRTW